MLGFVFNLNLALLALDHLITGSLAIFFPKTAIKLYKIVFGAHLPMTQEYFVILKPWGVLGVFAGLVGTLPIYDPVRYHIILWPLLLVLILRVVVRSMNNKYIEIYLSVNKKRNLFHMALIVLSVFVICVQIASF